MKSSNESVELDMKKLMSQYFRMVHKPTEVIDELAQEDVNMLETLVVTIISGIILIAGVFIAGGILYTTFQSNALTYPLEILTSGQLFGFYISYYDYGLVFLTDLIFLLKAWIFLAILLYGFLRIFDSRISIKRAAQVIAWSIFPFALIMFVTSLICLGFKAILPLYYHYIYFGVLVAVFIIVTPILVMKFLERLNDVSYFNSMRAYYLSLFVVFLIFAFNHADKFLYQIW